MSDAERSYFAGFFDGEGNISLVRGGPTITVAVVQVDRRPLDLLAERYGGRVTEHTRSDPERHRQAYRWQIHSSGARSFLRDIRPWLIVKAEQVDRVLGLPEPRKYTRKSDERLSFV